MPLGIVNSEDFESEINNSSIENIKETNKSRAPLIDNSTPDIITSDVIIKRHNDHGRNEGDVNVPQSLRKLIGDTATFEGRPSALQLANSLGISSASVSGYTNPANSSLAESNKLDISSFLTNRKNKISKRAINKLNLAISLIDEEKLAQANVKTISSVAKDMSQIVRNMEPPSETVEHNKVQFVMFAPQVKNELHYDTVVARDDY